MVGGLISLQLYGDYSCDSTATMGRVLATMQAGDSLSLPEICTLLGVPFFTDIAAIDPLAADAEKWLLAAWSIR
jgi:hypothetical protein